MRTMTCFVLALIASLLLWCPLIKAIKEEVSPSCSNCHTVEVNWEKTIAVSKCIISTSVVPTPLFNGSIPGNSLIPSHIWESLSELNLQRVRLLMWTVWPQATVPELLPPDRTKNTTSWDFTWFQEIVQDFLQAIDKRNPSKMTENHPTSSSSSSSSLSGHSQAIITASTFPQWLIDGNKSIYDPSTYPFPNSISNSYNLVGEFQSNTTMKISQYYSRIAQYLINGKFFDEFGNLVSGGPAYGLDRINRWEVMEEPDCVFPQIMNNRPFNGDYNYFVERYIEIFDQTVKSIREKVNDVDHKIKFTGLVLCGHGPFQFNNWWEPFLNHSNHAPDVRDALNSASVHYYAQVYHDSEDVGGEGVWSDALSSAIDQFTNDMKDILALRDTLSPNTSIYVDEIGAFLPGGGMPNQEPRPVPPDNWFVASNCHDYVAFGQLSEIGVELAGFSQFVGNMPTKFEAGKDGVIPDRQNPAISLIKWTNGFGNARYYGLKLLNEEFSSEADGIVETVRPPREKLCGNRWDYNSVAAQTGDLSSPQLDLRCASSTSTINKILKADMKNQTGNCDSGWIVSANNVCTDNGTLLKAVEAECLGKNSCSLSMYSLPFSIYQDGRIVSWCNQSFLNMVVEASCRSESRSSDLATMVDDGPPVREVNEKSVPPESTTPRKVVGVEGKGYASPSGYIPDRVYLQSRLTFGGTKSGSTFERHQQKKRKKKILFANLGNSIGANITISGIKGGVMRVVDRNEPARDVSIDSDTIYLEPFPAGVIILSDD